MILLQETQHLR